MTFQADVKDDLFQMLLINPFGNFAQFERDMIVPRIGEGRKRAIKNGNRAQRAAGTKHCPSNEVV
jgi:DNA invertase Pin-like site-specific DNA recombinase